VISDRNADGALRDFYRGLPRVCHSPITSHLSRSLPPWVPEPGGHLRSSSYGAPAKPIRPRHSEATAGSGYAITNRTRSGASLPTSVNNLSTGQFYGDDAIILTASGNEPRFRYRQIQGCRRSARTL